MTLLERISGPHAHLRICSKENFTHRITTCQKVRMLLDHSWTIRTIILSLIGLIRLELSRKISVIPRRFVLNAQHKTKKLESMPYFTWNGAWNFRKDLTKFSNRTKKVRMKLESHSGQAERRIIWGKTDGTTAGKYYKWHTSSRLVTKKAGLHKVIHWDY